MDLGIVIDECQVLTLMVCICACHHSCERLCKRLPGVTVEGCRSSPKKTNLTSTYRSYEGDQRWDGFFDPSQLSTVFLIPLCPRIQQKAPFDLLRDI